MSAHDGAPTATLSFPNTPAALFADEAGETMAEIETHIQQNTPVKPTPTLYRYLDRRHHPWAHREADIELRYAADGFVSGDATNVIAPPTNDAC